MNKICIKFLLAAFVLSVAVGGLILPCAGPAESAQTINGKALGSVDDVVKEVSKGDLSLQKKGLITLRAGETIDDIDIFATTFGKDASASTKRLYHNSNATGALQWTRYTPHYLRPAVSRKLYNGKRALMTHNFASNGGLKYYFKTLSNTRSENDTATSLEALTNSVQISDLGEYTPQAFAHSDGAFVPQVYGTGVMAVKDYDREVFVAASGPNHPDWLDKTIRLEFFAVGADDEGNMTQEPLTALTQEPGFRSTGDSRSGSPESPKIVSLAVGDLDGDKYENEVALMINTRNDIWIFVYRLTYSDGKLVLRSLGDANGIHVYSTDQWGDDIESQPVGDMVAGDFDGDGTDEIALFFKISSRATDLIDTHKKGWPNGPVQGDIHCKIHKWNAEKRTFDTAESSKSYTHKYIKDGTWDEFREGHITGVIGLRAAAADLDGDGKDEIVTLLLGYIHHKEWDAPIKVWKLRRDDFYAYPHLAVWTFNRGSITPVHDDAHVKGGGQDGENSEHRRYNYGELYGLAQGDKNKGLLMNEPHLSYKYIWYDSVHTDDNMRSGTNPDNITWMYALTDFSIAAGPFTGTLGTYKTVDDIAVAWKRNGEDRVTVFKTKLNGAKQFDGFADGKLVVQEAKTGGTWRGLIAADIASEGVELDTPVHLKKKSNRSYIAALSAVPYHVDTVSPDGSALTEAPVNFTYSEPVNGGNMTVSYGKSTTDTTTNTVKQDLSQSVETVFAADPTGTDQSVQGVLGTVKGLTAFASAIGDIAHGISVGNMSQEEKERAVWEPSSPTEGLTDMIEFFTDKVESVDQRTNTETSTTTIDKNITATTHDAILYTDTARHIWRYQVMTRPLPMWLAWGPRVDSTPIDNPSSVQGDKELFLTFTMSENSPLHTSSSITDSLYQPLHEEGNFFSYPSQIADVEGYNESGLLADEDTWEFSSVADTTGITFTKATSNMQHTEKNVTPSGFTMTTNFFDRLFNGEKATGMKMPDTENPKTFSKEYSKTERISYSLQGSSTLTAMQAADHTVKMQPFVAKEGAMTLGAAVELSSINHARLWEPGSIYQQKPDPALLLPQKFVKDGMTFRANTYDKSAMKVRGIRFYVPDFAFYSDNRLVNGLTYEIRVPLYNASFKDTGSFNVRLSWANDNSPTATKTPIGTVSMTLGGWKNEGTNNRGWAVFEWTPNLTPGRQYYFYVEIDPDNALDEVHEGRYESDNTTIRDYGGNNTGFYPFYAYDKDDIRVSGSGVVSVSNLNFYAAKAAEDDEIQLASLSFTDEDGNAITDMVAFLDARSDDSFVPITANFNNSGAEVSYAFLVGYTLTPSGKQKLPNASLNTIVDLSELESSDIDDVFMVNDFALLRGQNQITFNVSPAEILASADEIAAVADIATFGVIAITEENLDELAEEFYAGEDPNFELEEIPSYIVSNDTSATYTLTADENVFWNIASVDFSGTVAVSEDDYKDVLDINLETVSVDEFAPSNYGRTAIITVSSIAGFTPKGVYEITVQRSAYDDDDEWANAGVLKFNTEASSGNQNQDDNNNTPTDGNNGGDATSNPGGSGGGCDAGLGFGAFAFLMSGLMAFRRKNRA